MSESFEVLLCLFSQLACETFTGFLKNELEKADIKPRPAGNIEAPEPQELIDLEVTRTFRVPAA